MLPNMPLIDGIRIEEKGDQTGKRRMKTSQSLTSVIHQNLGEYVDMMGTWKERTYVVGTRGYREQAYTYGEFRKCVLGLSAEMKKRGIHRGDRVLITGRQSPEWVAAYFAAIYRGAAVVPLDPGSIPEFIEHVIVKTSPALILTDFNRTTSDAYSDTSYSGRASGAFSRSTDSDRAPDLQKTGDTGSRPQLSKGSHNISTIDLQTITQFCTEQAVEPEQVERKDLAAIVFTSGTTSKPKGVMLTHENILSNLEPIENGLQTKKQLVKIFTPLRLLCTVPFSHMFGQVTGIFLPLILGSSVYFTDDTSPAALIRKIKRNRILALITVPRIMKLMMDYVKSELAAVGKIKAYERKWERWQNLFYPLRVPVFLDIHRMLGLHFWAFIVGGAPLDPETHEFWRRIVYAVFQGYGLTETAPIVSMFNPFRHNRKSVGEIFPGREVKIGPDGEILVRGQSVMTGYFDNPAETSAVFKDGWLRTGDIGDIDENGQLYIRGRKKDVIVTSNGQNVYPEDIENVLNTIQGIREAVVIGKPGPEGEIIHAVLLTESGIDPETAIREANRKLQPFQRIKSFSLWQKADFPRTSTLKVQKNLVQKAIFVQEQTATAKEPEDILEGIVPGRIDRNTRLVQDLGLDSLDLIEVVCRIERKYGVSLDESVIGPETTLRDLETIAAKPEYKTHLAMPRWTRKRWAVALRLFFLNCLILPAFRIPCRLTTQGLENLNEISGPCIICANHTSDLDPLTILLALPRRYRRLISPAMGLNRFYAYFSNLGTAPSGNTGSRSGGKTDRNQKTIKRMIHGVLYLFVTLLFNTYPFPQGTAYRPSFEYSGELLDAGFWILLFPEGMVSQSGEMGSFRGGVSLLAEKTGVPVLPICIQGMHNVLPPGKFIPKRGKVYVSLGRPMHYCNNNETFTKMLEQKVKQLCMPS